MSNITWEERYQKLNEKQKEAVNTVEGPVLVIAGPGSGKTELLSIRTANILKLTDILPSNILLLTFTDSASFNMRERLISLIGEDAYRVGIYTFHSFASDIINKYPELFFNAAKFTPATEVDQINIIENILKTLPRKNPLASFHPELGFVYLRDIISAIRDLKKGNFTPETFAEKIKENISEFKKLKNIFDDLENLNGKRKYSEVIETYTDIYNNLSKEADEISKLLLSTLSLAIKKASENEKTTPLTAWKNAYTVKTESGKFILQDSEPHKIEKLESLLGVYSLYQAELYKNALYDFEDMILLTVKAIKENGNLRADLQEKFQYIMIDEFQDTNESQFQLVLELTKNSYLGKSPNVLAVGDDDQAIYKFQGAELNNIYTFIKSFDNTKTIVLDKNYRSTQNILDFARKVILKAEDRLEVRDKNIFKNLIASSTKYLSDIEVGEIKIQKFENEFSEYESIAKEIKKLVKTTNPKEIAVICRKHEQLKNLSNVLNNFKIPYSYSKRENVLEKSHIHELVTIVKFLHLKNEGVGDELLPEILSYNFWNLERIEIWRIAEKVLKEKISWLEAMIASPDLKIKQIANFLIELVVKSRSTPLEYLLDEIIGTTEYLWEEGDTENITPRKDLAKSFISPYKNYYFNNEKLNRNKTEYLDFLFALRTFIGSLREFHSKEILYAKDILEFEQTYNGNNLTLSVVSPFSSSENAVSLLTAHAAKGLEFEYVFLLSADQNVWGRGNRGNKISFPVNMPLTPESENDDDKIRLLYVALTRAKHTLYISHNSQKLEFLPQDVDLGSPQNIEPSDELINSLQIVPEKNFLAGEKHLLKRLLEDYKMPVTHLNNFLNFTRVGPSKFIEQSILHFPQAMSANAAYGSAMHEAVEKYFLNKSNLKESFKISLERARLPKNDFEKFLESGYENLEIYRKYLDERKILPDTKVEVKFRSEDVILVGSRLTGNIDRMEFVGNNEIIVTDLKTGESYDSFEKTGLQDYEKIKLHFYKYQLVFYSLMVENSRSYSKYKVKVGNLEFLEANKKGGIDILPFEIDGEIKARLTRLIGVVWKKINNLDFPDTTNYPQSYKGILQFEEDLLNGEI